MSRIRSNFERFSSIRPQYLPKTSEYMAGFGNMPVLYAIQIVFLVSISTYAENAQAENEAASPAADPIPQSSFVTRNGIRVIYVEAPQNPWAVVQLHVRSNGAGMEQSEHTRLGAWSRSLAEGKSQFGRAPSARQKIIDAGGEVRIQRFMDQIVISDELPADALALGLRVMNDRLRQRSRLAISAIEPLPLDDPPPPRVPLEVRQLLFPTHPYAYSQAESQPGDPSWLLSLSTKLLRKDNFVLVVTGPKSVPQMRRLLDQSLTVFLPSGGQVIPPVSFPRTVRIAERAVPSSTQEESLVQNKSTWFPITLETRTPSMGTPEQELRRQAKRYAKLKVLAQILGGHTALREGFAFMRIESPLSFGETDRAGPDTSLREIENLSLQPILESDLRIARELCLSQALLPLREPTGLAAALGRAALRQKDAQFFQWELQSYSEISVTDIQDMSKELVFGPHVFLHDQSQAERAQ
jgi:predicted Zn-dependent peptidase